MNKAFIKTFLNIELADTQEQRRKGFQDRENLNDYEAKLFAFPSPSKQSMWMKNTQVPLDIIFLSENGEVLNIEQGEPENTDHIFSDGDNCTHVLELKQGQAEELGIETGDNLDFLL